ncbi:MAG: hypothetical protein NXY59_00375 [Aigarchaeota archaeon]|nr:hypothetical protein [Candidatus Pelearchaeum maunauluense]
MQALRDRIAGLTNTTRYQPSRRSRYAARTLNQHNNTRRRALSKLTIPQKQHTQAANNRGKPQSSITDSSKPISPPEQPHTTNS